jgi:hypothetical protein
VSISTEKGCVRGLVDVNFAYWPIQLLRSIGPSDSVVEYHHFSSTRDVIEDQVGSVCVVVLLY